MTYAEMAEDVAEYLTNTLPTKPVLMGHSMGGKTAMQYALAHGENLAKLIVVDIAPAPNQHDFDNLLEAMKSLDTENLQRRTDADDALSSRVPDAALRQFLLQNLVANKPGHRWRINLHAIDANMPAILDFPLPQKWRPFEQPTLFIRGENSTYLRTEHKKVIKKLFPNTHTVTIKNAGHWLHAEQPQRFLEEVRSFLTN